MEKENTNFLEQYQTQKKPEAMRAAQKKERLTSESDIARDSTKRVEAYIQRLENIFLNKDTRRRERNITLIKPLIYQNTLITREDFPTSHFEFARQFSKDRGIGDISFDDEMKQKEIDGVIENQRKSIDAWIDYLTSDDCRYPADIKFFVMQGILQLGNFDSQNYSFTKRNKTTTAPFAEIDREALSIVMGALEAKHHQKPTKDYSKKLLDLIDEHVKFGDMYASVMQELDQALDKSALLPITNGQWRVFFKGSDPRALVDSLSGKRSNLCIADIGAASSYLSTGSIEIYFSHDREGQPIIPRIAITHDKEKGGVYEVRGTYNKNEDLDPYVEETNILMARLKALPNGEIYAKKDKDMKQMTDLYRKTFQIDKKTKEKTFLNPEFNKDELKFLYEIKTSIEGFGYERDPRIKEIRDQRNPEIDMLIVFECTPEQIVHNSKEIDENTKAYIGAWDIEIFQKICLFPNIKHLYEQFPDKKIFMPTLKTDSAINTPELAEAALKDKNIRLSDWGEDILSKTEFSKDKQTYNLVRFTVAQLGFPNGATTQEIYNQAEKLGLELCPAEVGLHLRLQYTGKEWMLIAMEPIADRDGDRSVFNLRWYGDRLELGASDAGLSDGWNPDDEFVFRLRKLKT